MELCIQLAIIFVGKQLLQNTLMEIIIPRTKKFIKKCLGKDDKTDKKKLPWEKDYLLEELGQEGLFREYLEMSMCFAFFVVMTIALIFCLEFSPFWFLDFKINTNIFHIDDYCTSNIYQTRIIFIIMLLKMSLNVEYFYLLLQKYITTLCNFFLNKLYNFELVDV